MFAATDDQRLLGHGCAPECCCLGPTALAVACDQGGIARAATTEQTLFSFRDVRGSYTHAGLIADGAGNLYGTTFEGGTDNKGVVFELSPPAQAQTAWSETVLRNFNGPNGRYPAAGLLADGVGVLYGTTQCGGLYDEGMAFRLTH